MRYFTLNDLAAVVELAERAPKSQAEIIWLQSFKKFVGQALQDSKDNNEGVTQHGSQDQGDS